MKEDVRETDSCHYCARIGRKQNLAKVTWLVNGNWNQYCPDCLESVLGKAIELSWNREYGYKVEYPWRDK